MKTDIFSIRLTPVQGGVLSDEQIDVLLQSWLRQVFPFDNHFYAVKVSTESGRVLSTTETRLTKIILHRIISVVWLTNFLSEIRSFINPRWWGEHLLLSVKRCQGPISYWNWTHWWSLASCLVREADGGAAVWVVQVVLIRDVQSLSPCLQPLVRIRLLPGIRVLQAGVLLARISWSSYRHNC